MLPHDRRDAATRSRNSRAFPWLRSSASAELPHGPANDDIRSVIESLVPEVCDWLAALRG
jgi:hypothetical protein